MPARTMPIAAALMWLTGVTALAGVAGSAAANEDRVTFVEFVLCDSGVCEPRRKTVPVVEVVRERDEAIFCREYTRRLTGFKSFPSLDPAVPIQVPQFEESARRYFRCDRGDSLAASGIGSPPSMNR